MEHVDENVKKDDVKQTGEKSDEESSTPGENERILEIDTMWKRYESVWKQHDAALPFPHELLPKVNPSKLQIIQPQYREALEVGKGRVMLLIGPNESAKVLENHKVQYFPIALIQGFGFIAVGDSYKLVSQKKKSNFHGSLLFIKESGDVKESVGDVFAFFGTREHEVTPAEKGAAQLRPFLFGFPHVQMIVSFLKLLE